MDEKKALFESPLWVSSLLHHKKMRKIICDQHFQAFDSNGNGQLEEGELADLCQAVCTAMHVQAPEKNNLHSSFLRFDRSESGGLTASEFARFFEHLLRASLPLMTEAPKMRTSAPECRTAQNHAGAPIPPTAGAAGYFQGSSVPLAMASANGDDKELDNTSKIEAGHAQTCSTQLAPPPADGDTRQAKTPNEKTVTVSVRSLGGDIVLGPVALPHSYKVVDLRSDVAATATKPDIVILLAHGCTVLALDSTISSSGITVDAELTATVATPECIVETAITALAECPAEKKFFGVGAEDEWTEKTDWRGLTDQVVGDRWNTMLASPEHKSWVDNGARVVRAQLETLADAVSGHPEYEKVVEDFAVKVLDVRTNTAERNAYHKSLEEMYPDELTWMAAKVLPAVSRPGNEQVHKAVLNWVWRIINVDFDITSSRWTLDEVLKQTPRLLMGANHRLLERASLAIAGQGGNLLNHYDPGTDWLILNCYWAIIGLADHGAKSGLRSLKTCSLWDKLFWKYGLTAHHEYDLSGEPEDLEEEWMEEYMYHRDTSPKDTEKRVIREYKECDGDYPEIIARGTAKNSIRAKMNGAKTVRDQEKVVTPDGNEFHYWSYSQQTVKNKSHETPPRVRRKEETVAQQSVRLKKEGGFEFKAALMRGDFSEQ